VVTRQRITAGAAQQLSLHVEAYKECTLAVTMRVAGSPDSPEERVVASWQVLRSLTLPAVKLPALPMGAEKGAVQPTFILDVRLVPEVRSSPLSLSSSHSRTGPCPLPPARGLYCVWGFKCLVSACGVRP
jgi:hypothetical protein